MNSEKNNINEFVFSHFREGDEKAFEYIFSTYYNPLVGFCKQFVYQGEDAKNIVQETFVNLWLNREKIEKIGGIKSFLYTYAKSKSLNFIRHKKMVGQYSDKILNDFEKNLNLEVLETFDFESYEIKEFQEIIQKSIEELPEKCRAVFIFKRHFGKSNKEIALEMNISVKP